MANQLTFFPQLHFMLNASKRELHHPSLACRRRYVLKQSKIPIADLINLIARFREQKAA